MTALAPKPWITAIAPYVPGRAKADDGRPVIKLSANENPLGTPPAAREAFDRAGRALDRYPDGSALALREAIAARHGLDPARIVHGTGSDEVLHLAAGAFAGVGDEVLYVRYGFAVYPIAARRVGAEPIEVSDENYGTGVDRLLAAVTPRTRLVYIANPNNPTGTFIERAEVRRLHAGLPEDCLLVLDGAYAEYLEADEDDGSMELATEHPNVLVTRTFSKIYGLAAERIGWAYGSAMAIDAMNRIRAPFNVTSAGQAAAVAALGDDAFVAESRRHNREWRGWLTERLAALPGLRVIPSKANFVLVLFEGALTAEAAFHGLMAAGYATRWLPGQGLAHGLRITVGSEVDCRAIADALERLVTGAG